MNRVKGHVATKQIEMMSDCIVGLLQELPSTDHQQSDLSQEPYHQQPYLPQEPYHQSNWEDQLYTTHPVIKNSLVYLIFFNLFNLNLNILFFI